MKYSVVAMMVAMAAAAHGAVLLTDSFNGSMSTNWIQIGTNANAYVALDGEESPFTAVGGGNSLRFYDQSTTGEPNLQFDTPDIGIGQFCIVSFDIKIPTTATSPNIQIKKGTDKGSNTSMYQNLTVNEGSGNVTKSTSLAATWYHYTFTYHPAQDLRDTYDIVRQAYGSTNQVFSGIGVQTDQDLWNSILFMYNTADTTLAGEFLLDNVSITTSNAVLAGAEVTLLAPAALTVIAPATVNTGSVVTAFVYGPSSNNVVLTGMVFSNQTHSGAFSSLDSFPITMTNPSPSNTPLSFKFDAAAGNVPTGATATATMVVNWSEVGSGITNQSEATVSGMLIVAPTGVFFQDTFEGDLTNWSLNSICNTTLPDLSGNLAADPVNGANNVLKLNYLGLTNAVASKVSFGNINYFAANTHYLLDVGFRVYIPSPNPGANLLFKASIGNFVTGGEDIANLNLNDNGTDFTPGDDMWHDIRVIINNTGSAIPYNQGGGIAGTAGANSYQVWNGTNMVQQQAVTVPANFGMAIRGFGFVVNNNQGDAAEDFYVDNVLIQGFMPLAPVEPPTYIGSVTNALVSGQMVMSWLGQEAGVYAVQKNTDLVYGSWTNVQQNIVGIGTLSATNDTTSPAAFYRVILQ